jgi:hypothetical protein
MSNSKLLKQAIADAKAVKETALANAKLALEEAFTPRLQSILSQKLRAEAEETEMDSDDDETMQNEELDSSEIGSSDMKEPSGYDAHTEFEGGSTETESGEPGSELDDYSKVKDLTEEEDMDDMDDMDGMDDMDFGDDSDGEEYEITGDEEEETDEDEMDLESIIRELESSLEGGEDEEGDDDMAMESLADGEEAGTDKGEDPKVVVSEEEDEEEDTIDLEEILREMESDMKDGEDDEKEKQVEETQKLKNELNQAYEAIKSLQGTINEVNLLNAKLLFANKLFRAHNMTNEQKVKVIETLDRTKSVREVKLVYSTLAENFKYTSVSKVSKKAITEVIGSRPVKSTKPAAAQQKQVISENADFANRFKKLAGIIK